jgi:hypothetical protein
MAFGDNFTKFFRRIQQYETETEFRLLGAIAIGTLNNNSGILGTHCDCLLNVQKMIVIV